MIRSVNMEHFRGIRSGRLDDLTPLTVLVGPNGCGKSTVLDAVLVGASLHPLDAVERVARRRDVVPGAVQWLFWRGSGQSPAVIGVHGEPGNSRVTRLQLQVAPSGGEWSVIWQELAPVSRDRALREGVVAFTRSGDGHSDPLSLPPDTVTDVRLVEPSRLLGQAPLHELYSAAVRSGRRAEIRDVLQALVQATDVEILTEGSQPVVHLVFPDHSVPLEMAGDGIGSLARLALELAGCQAGVVLVEEPEAHMHPGALVQVARAAFAVVRRGVQLIISTHSLELIDMLVAEAQSPDDLAGLSVYSLRCDGGILKSYRLVGDQVADARGGLGDDLR